MSIDPNPVLLKDATLEQTVRAISAKIEAKDLNYTEEELATASKNIKTAISRINYAWNLPNSPIFRLPDHLILRIFEHLQGLAHENPSKTHPKWWDWLKVISVCRAWRRISIEGSNLWGNVHILHKMPVSFLGLILDRAGEMQLAVHFRSCDYLRSGTRRNDYLSATQRIANRVKNLTVHVTASARRWERDYLPHLFVIPHRNLESLDLSFNAFYTSSSWHGRCQPVYQPDIGDMEKTVMLQLITLIPADQLKYLTLRHIKGWPPKRFGNLTSLTLFGYADGAALVEAVSANPALRNLKLESIRYKDRYSYDRKRLVSLDGQTLELVRCEPGVLSMFTLSSTCSLIITRTMDQYAVAYEGEIPEFGWLPEDISAIRCLHGLEEVHFSITKIPGKKGWIATEQKTIGYSTSKSTLGTGPEPSVTFTLTYYSDGRAQVPFEPHYLLPHPTPWANVIRASFDGFHDQFRIRDDILTILLNLQSLTLRRCDSGYLVRLITPTRPRGLESLQFEDELSGADFGDTLSKVFESRHLSTGLQLKELKIVTPNGLVSKITTEQMGRLKKCVGCIEIKKAPGYRSVLMAGIS